MRSVVKNKQETLIQVLCHREKLSLAMTGVNEGLLQANKQDGRVNGTFLQVTG